MNVGYVYYEDQVCLFMHEGDLVSEVAGMDLSYKTMSWLYEHSICEDFRGNICGKPMMTYMESLNRMR